jgi:hypothetical protein
MRRDRSDMASVATRAVAPRAMTDAEKTTLTITTREELINALQEAIQLEHGLMLQYLYAALSCKRREEGLSEEQAEAVRDWEGRILRIAQQEMAHLATACNLVNAVGGSPDFTRPHFPQKAGRWFPFDFVLEAFGTQSLERFIRFESPETELTKVMALAPAPITYEYIGALYRSISAGFATLRDKKIDLFVGAPEVQDSGDWSGNMKIFAIVDVPSARSAIQFIVEEGEGTATGGDQSHYGRFKKILEELKAAIAADRNFVPARNVVSNPLTRPHPDVHEGAMLIEADSIAHPVAELFNHVYTTILLLLSQFFNPAGETREQRAIVQDSARRAMSGIVRPLGEVLTRLPATKAEDGLRCGPPFELYGPLNMPSYPRARWAVLLERVAAEEKECRSLATKDKRLERLGFIADNLKYWSATLAGALSGRS